MCYILAKDIEKQGCYALKTSHGKHLSDMIDDLNKSIGKRGIQLVTISRPAAYGEYAPYTFMENEGAFCQKVLSM